MSVYVCIIFNLHSLIVWSSGVVLEEKCNNIQRLKEQDIYIHSDVYFVLIKDIQPARKVEYLYMKIPLVAAIVLDVKF